MKRLPFFQAGLTITLMIWALELMGVYGWVDRKALDYLSRYDYAAPEWVDNMAVVQVDASTVVTYGEGQWPFSRLAYAIALHSLRQQGVRGAGFEMVFLERDPAYSIFDGTFANQVSRFPHTVFAAGALKTGGDTFMPLGNMQQIKADPSDVRLMPSYSGALFPLEVFAEHGKLGFHNFAPDIDGVVRSVPLLFRFGDEVYPSFLLQCLMAYEGVQPGDVSLEGGKLTLKRNGEDIHCIPLDRLGRLLIRFRPNFHIKNSVGLDVLVLAAQQHAKKEGQPAWDMELLPNRFVFISREAPQTCKPITTPMGDYIPMKLHAAAWQTIFSEDFLTFPPHWAKLALYIFMSAILMLLIHAMPKAWAIILSTFLLLDIFILIAVLFYLFNLWLSVMGLWLVILANVAVGFWCKHRPAAVGTDENTVQPPATT